MQSAVQPASTNVKNLLPAWAWNILALFFAGWLVTAGWQLASGYDAPAIRLAFAVSGVLCLMAGSYGKFLSLRLPPTLLALGKNLIILLLIFGSIGAILWPMYSMQYDRGRQSSAHSVLQENGIALLEYAQKHNGKLPPDMHSQAIGKYLGFRYKSETRPGIPIRWCSALSNMSPADFDKPHEIVVSYSGETYSNGRNHMVLFLNGHVQSRSNSDFREILHQQPALIAQAEKTHAKRLAASRKHNTQQ